MRLGLAFGWCEGVTVCKCDGTLFSSIAPGLGLILHMFISRTLTRLLWSQDPWASVALLEAKWTCFRFPSGNLVYRRASLRLGEAGGVGN